jgi:hypothetical protein
MEDRARLMMQIVELKYELTAGRSQDTEGGPRQRQAIFSLQKKKNSAGAQLWDPADSGFVFFHRL